MAFSEFKNINSVLKSFPLKIKREKFLPDAEQALPVWFIENINFAIQNKPINANEFFLCESFIYPFLQEAWKQHQTLQLWSHQTIYYDEQLSGEPDYLISRISDKAVNAIITKPLVVVVEAKKEDFNAGWGQCLAEMIACQKLNDDTDITIFGIVTSGELWYFSKLHNDAFIEHRSPVSIESPNKIFGNLNFILNQCE